MADDILCVLGQEDDLEPLSQLFSEAPEKREAPRFFGDFFISVDVMLADMAPIYGMQLEPEYEQLRVATYCYSNSAVTLWWGINFSGKGWTG